VPADADREKPRMDLTYTAEEEEFRSEFRSWLDANLPQEWRRKDYWAALSDEESFGRRRDWEAAKARAGWSGIDWLKEYGGFGGTAIQKAIHDEEMGLARAPASVNRLGLVFLAPTIMAIGTEEQKRDLIPSILSCDVIWCQGFSEPDAGSDLAALKTRATDEGDHWLLNGQKVWTSNARHGDKMFCLARTSPDEHRQAGLTMLLFDMDLPGVDVRPLTDMSGAQDFGEVFFTDVRVPKSGVLGEVGQGWRAAMLLLSFERGSSAVEKYNEFRPEFLDLLALAGTATSSDGAPRHTAVLRQRIANVYIELELLRLQSLYVLTKVARGEDVGVESSLTKLQWSETHQDMWELVMDLLGEESQVGSPTTRLGITPQQQTYLRTRAETIYGGSSQVQRNLVAERILGLPR
jgi:alkylation response protein AidB-like acyl-CoA dehydrogenase